MLCNEKLFLISHQLLKSEQTNSWNTQRSLAFKPVTVVAIIIFFKEKCKISRNSQMSIPLMITILLYLLWCSSIGDQSSHPHLQRWYMLFFLCKWIFKLWLYLLFAILHYNTIFTLWNTHRLLPNWSNRFYKLFTSVRQLSDPFVFHQLG